MKSLITIILLMGSIPPVFGKDPDCAGVDRWPTSMAFGYLKNAGFTDNDKVDFTKTTTVRLASEKIRKNLYRQVHHIKFTEKTGNIIEVITVNEASDEECSMSAPDVYVITKQPGKNRSIRP